ncbi:two-component system, NtrC family, nitrogen regulation sensor histidine kinase NtrY [Candidatus Magnetomoraceae bacterium gMMP-13]
MANRFKKNKIRKNIKKPPDLPGFEKRKRKREVLIAIIILIFMVVFTYLQTITIRFGAGIPISNTVLMFILININVLLLLVLIFLVFRNLIKLLYERKHKVMGANLRTKLVIAFISLLLVPTILIFYFSIQFIATSIEFWFNAPVEQALSNSLSVGRNIYTLVENNNRFFLEKIASQIVRRNIIKNSKRLLNHIQVAQRAFNIHGVEIYSTRLKRIGIAIAQEMEPTSFKEVSADHLQKDFPVNGIRIITSMIPEGELIKSIGTIPFNVERSEIKAIIVVSTLISGDLSQKLNSISRGFEEYQQIQLLKKPIKITHYIILSIVALLIVFCAIWFALRLSKSLTIPIMELAEGTRRVADGDLNFIIDLDADDEMGSLVKSFNKMTKDLRTGNKQLSLSTHKLQEQYIEIKEKRQYMEIVLQNISTGVISLDSSGCVSTINKSAEKMLGLRANQILEKSYKDILRGKLASLAQEIMESLESHNSVTFPLRSNLKGKPQSFMIHVTALKDSDNYMGLVVVIDDLTEQERAQRMAAWREVARRVAHEVKNPLTPINLSAQRLKRKYSRLIKDSVFDECTNTIVDQVEQIRNLVNEFSSFARFPTAKLVNSKLPPIVGDAVALYREGTPHIQFNINMINAIPVLKLDDQQIIRVFINLFDNAIAAIKDSGSITISMSHHKSSNTVKIEVADTGPGISPENKEHLFEPYFSTKKAGMGLGLSIVNSIIIDHNGSITVEDNKPKGTKFIIEFPA